MISSPFFAPLICLSAKLLLACDGANSRVRQLLNIGVDYNAYYQKCIVCNIEFTGNLDQTAWQRFLSTGPIGLLPLKKGMCSLAWSCDTEKAHQLLSLSDQDFILRLEKATNGRLEKIIKVGKRAAFPLVARHAKTYTQKRAAILGDAAHVMHPLAGLGANIGFQDVLAWSKLLNNQNDLIRDIGREHNLAQYEKIRKSHNQIMISSMTMFNNLFSNDNVGLITIRDLWMKLSDKLHPAKKILLKNVMWMGKNKQEIHNVISSTSFNPTKQAPPQKKIQKLES